MKDKVSKILKFIWNHKVRVILSAVLIAALFITPLFTQAQYFWKLNGYTIVQAKEFYFQSNSMKPTKEDGTPGAEMSSSGWTGVLSPIKPVEIRNFENTLLANKNGEDVEYAFTWSIETYIAQTTGDGTYTYEKADAAHEYKFSEINVTRDIGNADFPLVYNYSDSTYATAYGRINGDGTPNKDVYSFGIQLPTDGGVPAYNSYIKVTLNARNVTIVRNAEGAITEVKETDSFSRNISCVLYYYITTTSGFVTSFDTAENVGYKDLDLNIGTGTSPDMSGESQSATIWWDNSKLEINPLCYEFLKAKENGGYHAQYSAAIPGISSLTITGLGSVAMRNLKFYKKGNDRNEQWFTNLTKPTLLAKNIMPESEYKTEDQILGYYVQEIETGGGETGGDESE